MTKKRVALPKLTAHLQPISAKQKGSDNQGLKEWQIQAIHSGIADANAGKLWPHSEAVKRLRAWGKHHP